MSHPDDLWLTWIYTCTGIWSSHHSWVSGTALINQTTYLESKRSKRKGKYELFHELCKHRKQTGHKFCPAQPIALLKKTLKAWIPCTGGSHYVVYILFPWTKKFLICAYSSHKKKTNFRCLKKENKNKQTNKRERKTAAWRFFSVTKCFSIRQLFIRTFVNTGVEALEQNGYIVY